MTPKQGTGVVTKKSTRDLQLFPVRIDVFSDDRNLRIVDSLLVDPTVWPVPLPRYFDYKCASEMDSAVDANSQYLANSILSDAEVMGMGRTARHFTGRVDLWSDRLQKKIADQIRPQILEIIRLFYCETNSRNTKSDEIIKGRKRPRDENNTANGPKGDFGDDQKIHKTSAEATTASGQNPKPAVSSTSAATDPVPSSSSSSSNTQSPPAEVSFDHLIPIRLRLSVHGVRIHDDLLWDPTMPVSPLEMANAIAEDLGLANEAIQAIAIHVRCFLKLLLWLTLGLFFYYLPCRAHTLPHLVLKTIFCVC